MQRFFYYCNNAYRLVTIFFEEPFVMTEGGPLDGTISIALFIYQAGFSYSNFGYAAAASFVLFVIIIIATLIQFTLRRKQGDM